MPSKVVQMIWSMPVYPSPSEQLCSPAVRVRGADDSLPAGFQYLMNVPQKGRRIRCMLDHLVERDNIELLWSIAGRLEQARRNIESVPLRDAKNITMGLDAMSVTSPSPRGAKGFAEATSNIANRYVTRYPAEHACINPAPT